MSAYSIIRFARRSVADTLFVFLRMWGDGKMDRICPVGDQALLCEFRNSIDEDTNNQVQRLATQIRESKIKGVEELLPTYRSLLVFYDKNKTSYSKVAKKLQKLEDVALENKKIEKKIRVVPCCYEGEFGPDLIDMSKVLDLSPKEIIEIHQSSIYKIYMLGFLPGFVYLGGLDKRIHIPRLETPRTKIPARSVGIGGNQTGVYPMESPGGWRLIGRTPLDFYNPQKNPPVLCAAGEYIKFQAVSEKEYVDILIDVKRGRYKEEYI